MAAKRNKDDEDNLQGEFQRFNLNIPVEQLEDLRRFSKANVLNIQSCIRVFIRLGLKVWKHLNAGGEVIFRDKDGKEISIWPFWI